MLEDKKERAGAERVILFLVALLFISCNLKRVNLMPWEEYVKLPREQTYVLEVTANPGALLYCGIQHTLDQEAGQIRLIEALWEEFRPTLGYCEGMRWPVARTKEEAIQKYGEQGLLLFLADRDGVPIRCIDPGGAEQVRYLRRSFDIEQINIYYILLHAALQRTRRNVLIGAEDVDKILRDLARIPEGRGLIRTFSDFESRVSHLFPELESWARIPCSYFDITISDGFLAKVHRKLNAFRDGVMTQKLARAIKGDRVFALVGLSHVIIQEPALRALFPTASFAVRRGGAQEARPGPVF